MLNIFLLGIQKTENFRENTNAPPALPIGNASALRASRGVHNKRDDIVNSIFLFYDVG